jgi:hypothetical protein
MTRIEMCDRKSAERSSLLLCNEKEKKIRLELLPNHRMFPLTSGSEISSDLMIFHPEVLSLLVQLRNPSLGEKRGPFETSNAMFKGFCCWVADKFCCWWGSCIFGYLGDSGLYNQNKGFCYRLERRNDTLCKTHENSTSFLWSHLWTVRVVIPSHSTHVYKSMSLTSATIAMTLLVVNLE